MYGYIIAFLFVTIAFLSYENRLNNPEIQKLADTQSQVEQSYNATLLKNQQVANDYNTNIAGYNELVNAENSINANYSALVAKIAPVNQQIESVNKQLNDQWTQFSTTYKTMSDDMTQKSNAIAQGNKQVIDLENRQKMQERQSLINAAINHSPLAAFQLAGKIPIAGQGIDAATGLIVDVAHGGVDFAGNIVTNPIGAAGKLWDAISGGCVVM